MPGKCAGLRGNTQPILSCLLTFRCMIEDLPCRWRPDLLIKSFSSSIWLREIRLKCFTSGVTHCLSVPISNLRQSSRRREGRQMIFSPRSKSVKILILVISHVPGTERCWPALRHCNSPPLTLIPQVYCFSREIKFRFRVLREVILALFILKKIGQRLSVSKML